MSDFTLHPELESLDAIPEKFHALYEERDGKFVLDSTLATKLKSDEGLKKALEAERKAAREKSKLVSRWESLGKTPEEIEELLAKLEEADNKAKAKEGDIEGLKKQYDEKLTKALTPLQQKAAKLEAKLQETLVQSAAVSAIAAEKGVPELLLPHVERRARVVEEDGEYVVKIFQPDGKTPMVNDAGEPATIADLIAQMKEDAKFGRAFESSGATGSGMPPSGKAAAGSGKFDPRKATPKEKSAFIEKHGLQSWLDLMNATQ